MAKWAAVVLNKDKCDARSGAQVVPQNFPIWSGMNFSSTMSFLMSYYTFTTLLPLTVSHLDCLITG